MTIHMYFHDHAPPHVHVKHAEDEVLLLIADGSVYDGSVGATQLREARAWLEVNSVELRSKWKSLGGAE